MKRIVISAVNLNQGGTLTIAKELLSELDNRENIKTVAIVHNKKDYPSFNRVKLVEIKHIKKSWLKRLLFEYICSARISKRLRSDYWICVHDMSARITHGKQYVYCHNPSPFYNDLKLKDLKYDWKFFLFVVFYSFLYRINIKRNTNVFVQQQWLARAFEDNYNLKNVVVTHPEVYSCSNVMKELSSGDKTIRIFYPSVPRLFKNFEIILDVADQLNSLGNNSIVFVLTLSGKENKYAKELYERYHHLPNVLFIGYLNSERMQEEYLASDVLCFPSKLETWGLPISEAKKYGLRLMLADLPYAHETAGNYSKVCFFDPLNASDLLKKIIGIQEDNTFNSVTFSGSAINGWSSFVDFVIKD